jgi:hypothetical protein
VRCRVSWMRENCQSRSEDAFDRHLSLGSLPSRTLPATTAPVVLSTCRSLCWNIILSTINIYIDLNDALALAEQSGQLKYIQCFVAVAVPAPRGQWRQREREPRSLLRPLHRFRWRRNFGDFEGRPFASTFCSLSPDFRGFDNSLA